MSNEQKKVIKKTLPIHSKRRWWHPKMGQFEHFLENPGSGSLSFYLSLFHRCLFLFLFLPPLSLFHHVSLTKRERALSLTAAIVSILLSLSLFHRCVSIYLSPLSLPPLSVFRTLSLSHPCLSFYTSISPGYGTLERRDSRALIT